MSLSASSRKTRKSSKDLQDERPVSTAANEPMARRSFLVENIPPYDSSAPFLNQDSVDWSSATTVPQGSFGRWRNSQLEATPTNAQEIDSSAWIDQVSARSLKF